MTSNSSFISIIALSVFGLASCNLIHKKDPHKEAQDVMTAAAAASASQSAASNQYADRAYDHMTNKDQMSAALNSTMVSQPSSEARRFSTQVKPHR